jgi:hypothetical protein
MTELNELRRYSHHRVRVADAAASGMRVRQFVVQNAASFGDYLMCNPWNGSEPTAELIAVAKPYLLRRTPFHDMTVDGFSYSYTNMQERTKTRSSDDKVETQVVVPRYQDANYQSGSTIYAVTGIQGGTGVVETGNEEDPTRKVVWLDLNVDGRAWAKKAGGTE